eukprot:jgi/Chlat1/8662/Chrsp87S08042
MTAAMAATAARALGATSLLPESTAAVAARRRVSPAASVGGAVSSSVAATELGSVQRRDVAALRCGPEAAGAVPASTQASRTSRRRQAVAALAVEAPSADDAAAPGDVYQQNRVARDGVRNIAIIAHVDHGKTTLVDGMLRQAKVFRDNQKVAERIMDSNDIERERGITILSKNTAITFKGTKINIIDTPGHADFGGEVERILNMVDGVLLLIDSVEGPMPQTRFVLKKALELGHRVVLVVNKVDRPQARCEFVTNAAFDLFLELNASEEQCEFPIVYASGVQGIAGLSLDSMATDLQPLFETIIASVPPPMVDVNAPMQLLITNLDYDDHKGRIAIGRVHAGSVSKGQDIKIVKPGAPPRSGRISELFVYSNFSRVPVDRVEAGDICAMTGLSDVMIGETVADKQNAVALPTITVEEPTVRMTFCINTSPFAGQEGKFVTSRNLRERLYRELERNLAMKIEDGDTADTFIVSGRGTLHIGILIENMRREGYEFCIGPPQVITKEVNGKVQEPYEEAVVEVPEEYVGPVVDLLGQRKGEMIDMAPCTTDGACVVKYRIPTRGLLGLRNAMLTATRGTAILNTVFSHYGPWCGDIILRENGSLVAFETGQTTSYALLSAQERGALFCGPGLDVYKGQIVGIHQRQGDLAINVCKKKQMTNIRSNKEGTVTLAATRNYSLDDAIEYISNDEMVEVTPKSIRMKKVEKVNPKAR